MYAGAGPRMKKTILIYVHHKRAETDPNGYRARQYSPYLNAKGFTVRQVTSKTPIAALVAAFHRADVVYIQRLLPDLIKQRLLTKAAKRIVFDFDDAVMYGMGGRSLTRRARFRRMIKAADTVLCGNQFLASEAEKYRTENIFYVPTVVDTAVYPVKEHVCTQSLVVGWMGSRSTLAYLQDIRGALRQVSPSVAFKVVANEAPRLEGVRSVFEPWSREREKEVLLDFDIGIMPVRGDIWSKGKCGLKLVQYGAAGLPSISHPLGVSNEIIQDGENGFLRKDEEGWRQAIDVLRADVDLRKRMGKKAREIAEEKYCLRIWGPRVADIIDNL